MGPSRLTRAHPSRRRQSARRGNLNCRELSEKETRRVSGSPRAEKALARRSWRMMDDVPTDAIAAAAECATEGNIMLREAFARIASVRSCAGSASKPKIGANTFAVTACSLQGNVPSISHAPRQSKCWIAPVGEVLPVTCRPEASPRYSRTMRGSPRSDPRCSAAAAAAKSSRKPDTAEWRAIRTTASSMLANLARRQPAGGES